MSITGGRGIYNTEFVRYEEVPTNIAEQIIEKRKAILEKEKQNKRFFTKKVNPYPYTPWGIRV